MLLSYVPPKSLPKFFELNESRIFENVWMLVPFEHLIKILHLSHQLKKLYVSDDFSYCIFWNSIVLLVLLYNFYTITKHPEYCNKGLEYS